MKRRTLLLATGAGIGAGGVALGEAIFGTGSGVSAEIRSLDVTTETLYPSHDYHFDTTPLDDPDEASGKAPIAFDALDTDLQSTVRQIITDDRPVGFDDPPPELLDTVNQHVVRCPHLCNGGHDYVELTYAETSESPEPALALYADVTGDRTGIHLTMVNTSDQPQTVYSSAGPPFGTVKATGTGETDHSFPLWSDFYEEYGSIRIRDGQIVHGDFMDSMIVSSSDAITRTYELSTRVADEFRPGEYVISPNADGSEYMFGEETDIPFIVTYVPADSETNDLKHEYVDFRVSFDLVEPD